jgi:hypothetical protein
MFSPLLLIHRKILLIGLHISPHLFIVLGFFQLQLLHVACDTAVERNVLAIVKGALMLCVIVVVVVVVELLMLLLLLLLVLS